jgi:hypothetical protein
MLPRPRTTACVVVVLVVLGEVCGQLLWESVRGGYFLRRSEGKGRAWKGKEKGGTHYV